VKFPVSTYVLSQRESKVARSDVAAVDPLRESGTRTENVNTRLSVSTLLMTWYSTCFKKIPFFSGTRFTSIVSRLHMSEYVWVSLAGLPLCSLCARSVTSDKSPNAGIGNSANNREGVFICDRNLTRSDTSLKSLELTLRFRIFQKLVTRLLSLLSEGDERECLVQTAPRQVTGLAVYQFPYLWGKGRRNCFKDALRYEYIRH